MPEQQLEQRLQQIAQRVTPCPIPDVAGGWNLCAHGLPWPCPTTEASGQIMVGVAWGKKLAEKYIDDTGAEASQENPRHLRWP